MALRWKGTRAELRAVLREVAAELGPRGNESVANGVLLRGAVALLSQIQSAFVVKARGGTDVCGIKWAPLAASTIARRRSSRKERRGLGIGEGFGTKRLGYDEKRKWRAVYRKTSAALAARGLDGAYVRTKAAASADAVLRRAGAKTKTAVLEGRDVEILRDTSALLRSFTPGYEESPARPEGQILEVEPGKITVGTEEKPWHHEGVPGRLPARPYWPTNGELPPEWGAAVGAALVRGLVRAIARRVQESK